MNGVPVEITKAIQKLQQLPGGAVLWELALTQVALEESLAENERLKNGSEPGQRSIFDEGTNGASGQPRDEGHLVSG